MGSSCQQSGSTCRFTYCAHSNLSRNCNSCCIHSLFPGKSCSAWEKTCPPRQPAKLSKKDVGSMSNQQLTRSSVSCLYRPWAPSRHSMHTILRTDTAHLYTACTPHLCTTAGNAHTVSQHLPLFLCTCVLYTFIDRSEWCNEPYSTILCTVQCCHSWRTQKLVPPDPR